MLYPCIQLQKECTYITPVHFLSINVCILVLWMTCSRRIQQVKRRAQTYQRLDHIDSLYVVVSFSIHSRGCGGDIWSPTQWSSSYDLRISWRMPDEVPARPRAIPCVLHINHKLSDARCPCWISSSPACLLIFVPSVTAWQPDICSITPLPNTHTRSSTGITMHSK